MIETVWTLELIGELTRRWDAGESATAIARAMGVTRNQAMGKIQRLGLAKRGQPESLANRTVRVKETTATGGCRWIEGNDFAARIARGENVYCGKRVAKLGSPWCDEHHARVWLPTRRKESA